ncbi:hypothetical protein L1887_13292 [Cichorium endivia]|nr:hypothetical protein L1887_13292 [Cichorium endivia]
MKKVDAFSSLEVLFFDLLAPFILFGNSFIMVIKDCDDLSLILKLILLLVLLNTAPVVVEVMLLTSYNRPVCYSKALLVDFLALATISRLI